MKLRIRSHILKQLSSFLFLSSALLPFHGLAAPAVLQSAVYLVNNHTYYLLQSSSWTDAENQAVALGGHLATVNDLGENNWIWNQWGSGRDLWIGLNDAAVEGSFVWSSGAPVSFTNWRPGEPNNFLNEDYAYIMGQDLGVGAVWNDFQNDGVNAGELPIYGVVEVVPEPAAGWLFAAGGLLLVVRRVSSGQRTVIPA